MEIFDTEQDAKRTFFGNNYGRHGPVRVYTSKYFDRISFMTMVEEFSLSKRFILSKTNRIFKSFKMEKKIYPLKKEKKQCRFNLFEYIYLNSFN